MVLKGGIQQAVAAAVEDLKKQSKKVDTDHAAIANVRSEERRVGKECRSLCDWSSDVCSSDLDGLEGRHSASGRRGGRRPEEAVEEGRHRPRRHRQRQIGRASCRERV